MFKQRGSSDVAVLFGLGIVAWGFLIAGAIMFPVAVIHGTGSWFGAW